MRGDARVAASDSPGGVAPAAGGTPGLREEAFVALLDGVVEHSPWVAREVYRSYLGDALEAAIRGASTERQLELVRAHPELSSGEALTDESAREQSWAGLDRRGDAQRALNAAYRERF